MPQTNDDKDDRLKAEQIKEQTDLMQRIEQLLSERIQEKKSLQRVK
jgi:hypothetical protein